MVVMARGHVKRDLFWSVVCALSGYGCMIEGEYLPDLGPSDTNFGALASRCGDGVRQSLEACDDGNEVAGDGCDASCVVELCWVCGEQLTGGQSSCGPQCDASAGQFCVMGTCVSCSDGARNGDETDVDCGGSCGPCAQGLSCGAEADCGTGFCAGGVCCNEACGDTCVRCDLEGARGICAYVPENEAHEARACGGTSVCDGKGACKRVTGEACGKGIECLSGRCLGRVCE
jgi:cysteine-rich repeat protein